MNLSKADVRRSLSSIPVIRYEDQGLTSFAGVVILQKLVGVLRLKDRLRACTRHLKRDGAYGSATVLLLLVAHVMLGWRRLRDLDFYRHDPMVPRLLGLHQLPNVSTVTRALRRLDSKVVRHLRALLRELVVARVLASELPRLTVDFDGSVLSTKSRASEGTAIGYNAKAKGSRSYYPLYATIAQTGQVFDVHHRPGNVHDSNGAQEFMASCFGSLRESGFRGVLEARIDGAHFSDGTFKLMEELGVDFSVSVPFLRFGNLKDCVQNRKKWHRIDDDWSYFELKWKPKRWPTSVRCVVYKHRMTVPRKGPIQLDIFEPIDRHYEYKVVATNKTCSPARLLRFHNGRGAQEGIFAELKSQQQLGYIPTRRLIGNQVWGLCNLIAHNLGRELQMIASPPQRGTSLTRACLWVFERFATIRHRVIQRAARLTRPSGTLTLTVSGGDEVRNELERYLAALDQAA
jgi:hypothetical protein